MQSFKNLRVAPGMADPAQNTIPIMNAAGRVRKLMNSVSPEPGANVCEPDSPGNLRQRRDQRRWELLDIMEVTLPISYVSLCLFILIEYFQLFLYR